MILESDLIAWLRANVVPSGCVDLGIGDDAAVMQARGLQVVTTDLLTDGVDFLIEEVTPEQIGHKALGVNLSDLAAMASRPQAVLVSLVLPRSGSSRLTALELAIGIYQGILPLAEKHQVTIAGGDTNTWDGPLAISITAIGESTSRGPLTRDGGKPGDRLLVTGSLGGSILGRHLQVEPRVREALLLHEQYEIHAGIDISDGLALDLSRLAEASHLGAILNLANIPVSDAARQLSDSERAAVGKSPLDHALSDGEDFELLLAVPPDAAAQILQQQPLEVPISDLGELTSQSGLWQRDEAGELSPLEPRGYQHGDHS